MIKAARELLGGVQISVYMLIIFAVSAVYIYILTKHVLVSALVGLFTMFFGFYHSVFLPKQLEREQYLLKELQKYATSMVFYMQSGYNVLQSLSRSRQNLDEQIRRDIEKTMIKLQNEAVLDTSHFERYNFPSLDIFHQILKIKYEAGGDTKELFSRVSESINFELVKRDELYRRKKYMRNRIFVMMAITLAMPLVIALFAGHVYDYFLETGIVAISINVGLFLAVLISMFFLQRNVTNISIH